MKVSKYNYYYVIDNQKTLIWNTFTGVLLCEDTGVVTALREGHIGDLPGQVFDRFLEKGILTTDTRNELSELEDELRERASGKYPERGGFFRILTTTRCNAACSYCYEKDTIAMTMDEETAHQTFRFIEEHQKEKPLVIEWFGGEPLINPDVISILCKNLHAARYSFTSRITTNGSLWTNDLIQVAQEVWHLKNAQFTLDGVGREHEAAKGLPEGAFLRTITAIHKLVESDIRVRIRVNHYKGQAQHNLVRWLAVEFAYQQGLDAYVAPGYSAGEEYPASLMQEVHELNLELAEAGLIYQHGKVLPSRRHIGCFACDPNNYTISPDGRLFNCSHNMTQLQCIGDVWNGVQTPQERWFLRREFEKRCKECVLLPVCMGGCRAAETGIALMRQCPPFKNITDRLAVMALRDHVPDPHLSGTNVQIL